MSDTDRTYPRVLNHVGLAVPDLEAAIDWYGRVLGFELFAGPFDLTADDGRAGPLLADTMPGVERVRVAQLAAGGGAGLELFQFITPASDPSGSDLFPPRGGFFHICVTDPDPAGLAARIAACGGRQRGQVWPGAAGKPYRLVNTEDPWGNLIEIYSHDFQRMYANLG